MQPPLKYASPPVKIITLFALLVICMQGMFQIAYISLHPLFGVIDPDKFIESIDLQAQNVRAALFLQAMGSSLGTFLIPAAIFCVLISGKVLSTLKLDTGAPFKHFGIMVILIVFSGLFIQLLVQINTAISLPPSLQFLRTGQASYEKLMNAFFTGSSVAHLVLLMVVLAIVPAISEEMMFRGVIQNQLAKSTLGNYGAIIVTGLMFSIMHFEFDNFLAIWAMGIVLGWLFYTTQSLWVSVVAHFINNATTVLLKYLYLKGSITNDLAEASPPVYISVISLFIVAGCMYLLHKWRIEPLADEIAPNSSEESGML